MMMEIEYSSSSVLTSEKVVLQAAVLHVLIEELLCSMSSQQQPTSFTMLGCHSYPKKITFACAATTTKLRQNQ